MDIISHTNRSKVIRHRLEKPTKIEFIEEDNVVKGTFKLNPCEKNNITSSMLIDVIDCDTKSPWTINCDSIISLELC